MRAELRRGNHGYHLMLPNGTKLECQLDPYDDRFVIPYRGHSVRGRSGEELQRAIAELEMSLDSGHRAAARRRSFRTKQRNIRARR